jgi:hypothetical protein
MSNGAARPPLTGWGLLSVLAALLILYTSPVLMALYYLASVGLSYDFEDNIPKLLQQMANEHTSALSLVHKIIIPLLTFVVAYQGKSEKNVRYPLIFLTGTLFMLAILTHILISVAIEPTTEGAPDEVINNLNSLFTRVSETMAAYFALLLGLEFGGSSKSDGGEGDRKPLASGG